MAYRADGLCADRSICIYAYADAYHIRPVYGDGAADGRIVSVPVPGHGSACASFQGKTDAPGSVYAQLYPDKLKGQDYEDEIYKGLHGYYSEGEYIKDEETPELVELCYYLRESDKQLEGTIYYSIGNGEEKSTVFKMASSDNFTRNHTWIVYGYFTGKETLTISSIDVTNWSLINTEHNVYNW